MKTEFLFRLYDSILYNIGASPIVFFAGIAFIQFLLFFSFFRKEPRLLPLLTVFLFTNGLFDNWMNTMRQDIACCIFLFSIRFIDEKKPLWYFLLCLVAINFHRSAFVLVFFYPLFAYKSDYLKKPKIELIIYIISFFLGNLVISYAGIIDNVITAYSQFLSSDIDYNAYYNMQDTLQYMSDVNTGNSGIGRWCKAACFAAVIIYSNNLRQFYKGRIFNIIYSLFFVGIVLGNLIPAGAIALQRPFRYLNQFSTICLAYLAYYLIHKSKTDKPIGYAIVVMQLLMFFGSLALSISSGGSGYEFIFGKI